MPALLQPTDPERAVIDLRVCAADAWPGSEHEMQRHIVEVCALYPALARLHAVPNGGHRHKATAGRLRAEGVRKGVPDLFLPAPRGRYHGLYLESKKRGGLPSPEQWDWLVALHRAGYAAHVVNDPDTAIETILAYINQK